MQMIDLLTRLNELDSANPNVQQSEQPLEECGMMGAAPHVDHHTPASISITADNGEELSSMLADIMTLAGRSSDDSHALGSMPAAAVVDVEPAGDGMGPPEMDATSSMRAVLDRMNDDDAEKVSEYDNEPDPETTGYSANVPSGDDLHREKGQYPAAQPGDNAMAATFESLMGEYRKYISEQQDVAEGSEEKPPRTTHTCEKCGKKWQLQHHCKGAPDKKQGVAEGKK